MKTILTAATLSVAMATSAMADQRVIDFNAICADLFTTSVLIGSLDQSLLVLLDGRRDDRYIAAINQDTGSWSLFYVYGETSCMIDGNKMGAEIEVVE